MISFKSIKNELIICGLSLCLGCSAVAQTQDTTSRELEHWAIARCAGMISESLGYVKARDDWYLTASALLEQQTYNFDVYEAINEYLADYLAESNSISHQGERMHSIACIDVLSEPDFRKLLP